MKIKALSKFWIDRTLIVPPQVIDVPELLVAELVNAHKAELVTEPLTVLEVPDGTAAATRPHKSKKDVQSVD